MRVIKGRFRFCIESTLLYFLKDITGIDYILSK